MGDAWIRRCLPAAFTRITGHSLIVDSWGGVQAEGDEARWKILFPEHDRDFD